jgi:hypothetical protein
MRVFLKRRGVRFFLSWSAARTCLLLLSINRSGERSAREYCSSDRSATSVWRSYVRIDPCCASTAELETLAYE